MNPNSDTSSIEPDDTSPSNHNAAAIEQARQRVLARQREEERSHLRHRRESRGKTWDHLMGIWDDSSLARLLFFGLLAASGLLISALAWLGENLRWPVYVLIQTLDALTGACALPVAPWLAWTFWGAIFGGALGYWLVAPLYGERVNRSAILLLPLLCMATIGLLTWCFTQA